MGTRQQTMSRSLSYGITLTISVVLVVCLLVAAPPEREEAKPVLPSVNAPLIQPSAMKAEYLATLSIAASGTPRIGPYSALSALYTGASLDSPYWTLRGVFSTRPGRINTGASLLFLTGFGPSATTPLMELVMLQAGEYRDCWNLIDTDVVRPFPKYFLEPGFIRDRRSNFKGVPEYEAFWQTLVLAHYTSAKAFAKTARRDVTYFNLFNEPELYRGQVVHLSGRLIRLVGYEAPDEARAAGVGDLYEGWIMTDANGVNPLCVAFTDLPPGLTVDNERKYNIPVGFDGYFYKRYRYKAVDSKKPNEYRDAPLLIGHSLTGKFGAAETDESDNWGHSLIWVFLAVLGGALVGGLALTAWFRYQDRRVRQRLRASRRSRLRAAVRGAVRRRRTRNELERLSAHAELTQPARSASKGFFLPLLALQAGKIEPASFLRALLMSTNPTDNGRRRVVVTPAFRGSSGTPWMKIIPVWIASAVVNLAVVGLAAVLFSFLGKVTAGPVEEAEQVQTTQVEEEQKDEADLTQTDVGMDSTIEYGQNVDRTNEDVVVPGTVDMTQAPGVEGAPTDAPRTNVPLPPGTGDGLGGALSNQENSLAIGGPSNSIGGMNGINLGNQFGGRSASTIKKMLNNQGGNGVSEAAVARGLLWLSLHQAQDGHWSLHDFNKDGRDKPRPAGKIIKCNCEASTGNRNDVAATGFGVLPFLGAGITHRSTKTNNKDYTKTVEGAIYWLKGRQNAKDGSYSTDMYAHGIATIAMCEAYGLTLDPTVKMSAQKALNFIVYAQDNAGGGWRYRPKEAGDTSVTGWQVMALKSGQMAGLSVPAAVVSCAERFLDSVESSVKGSKTDKGGSFSYVAGQPPTPTMTAVGLLCRQYGGVGPKNPALQSGVSVLKANDPVKNDNIYYLYYATQVMHHMQGDSLCFWNEGVDADNKKVHNGIRDFLISKQDKGTTPGHPHQNGSWPGSQGGRMMATSLSLLCLEVYYRHLPLYRRDIANMKDVK